MLTHVFQAKNLTFKGQFVHILCFFILAHLKLFLTTLNADPDYSVSMTLRSFLHTQIYPLYLSRPYCMWKYFSILIRNKRLRRVRIIKGGSTEEYIKTKMLNSMNKKMNNFIKTKILNSMNKKNNFIKKMLNSVDKNMHNFIKGRCCTILKNVEHSLTWGFQFCYCEGGVF